MKPTICTICRTANQSTVRYEANFHPEDINPKIFSARRLPDRVHYRMVTCDTCGLLRSDPVLDTETLSSLYKASSVTYQSDYPGLIATYTHYLHEALIYTASPEAMLEIGCGDGFFLKEAIRLGLRQVNGVEPSTAAIARADSAVRDHITQGLYRKDLFLPESFDIACLFQVIDHLPDPSESVEALAWHLKKGGVVLIISHDTGALTNRLLGARSPIIDIEHTYLFNKKTLTKLFEMHSLVPVAFHACKNQHTIRHWTELMPMPNTIKMPLLSLLRSAGISEKIIPLSAGNFICIAKKQ